jgi:hypothetical protein
MDDFKRNGYIVNVTDEVVLNSMPACFQECDEWCWATVVSMVVDHYKGKSECGALECKVAGLEFHHKCCPYASHSCHNKPDDPPTSCNQGGSGQEMAGAARHYTGKKFTVAGALSQSKLDKILRKAPIMIAVSWGQGRGGHALILASHQKKGHYSLHDPWGWYHNKPPSWKSLSYDGLLDYHAPDGGIGKWVQSIYSESSDESMVVV